MTDFLARRRAVPYLVLYFLIILYTLTFPTTVAWFLFYAFTLLLTFSYLTSSHHYVLSAVQWEIDDKNHIHVALTLKSKWKLPFFFSALKVSLYKDTPLATLNRPALFSREIELAFDPFMLPRGLHKSLMLEIEGLSLFGLWTNRVKQEVPVEIAVYPTVLPFSKRSQLIKELSSLLIQTQYSSVHDFYVKEVRTFQNRDALSDIDWKTSVKRGQWMVKEYEKEKEAPVDLFFYGYDTEDFEYLLRVAYTLYKAFYPADIGSVYLLGLFISSTKGKNAKDDFLTIQPSSNEDELARAFTAAVVPGRKQLVIKPRVVVLPSAQLMDQSVFIVDEHRLGNPRGEVTLDDTAE